MNGFDIRVVLDDVDFAALVRGEKVTSSNGVEIVLADIGFAAMRKAIDDAEGVPESANLILAGHIEIENHGPLVVGTNYWRSECDRDDDPYLDYHANAFRLLLPNQMGWAIEELSRSASVEIVHTVSFFGDTMVVMVGPERSTLTISFWSRYPEEEERDDLVFTVWTERRGKPRKALERPCFYRRYDPRS
tara:strand:- start:1271 stop:1840 length:570 start_codon:yes stop_codon:yes gene_type:complete